MKHKELYRKKHIRDDGWLSELVSMEYNDTPFDCFHSYLVSIKPGRIRAKHYHNKKEEWIAIVSGKIALLMKDVYSGEQDKMILDTTTEDYKMIYLPPYTAHAIKSIGDGEASVVVFSTMPEDPGDTIPYKFEDV
jgi:dTDP-4-dehydrorhamnose 3,5-epimerase-like enzyme